MVTRPHDRNLIEQKTQGLAMQAVGPEFNPQAHAKEPSVVCVLEIPWPRRWRRLDTQGWRASQPELSSEFQTNKVDSAWGTLWFYRQRLWDQSEGRQIRPQNCSQWEEGENGGLTSQPCSPQHILSIDASHTIPKRTSWPQPPHSVYLLIISMFFLAALSSFS